MNLEKIISISGKPGLFKLVSQSKGGFIVEELETGKKSAISSQNQVSLLENIAIYTYEDDVPLADIFMKMAEKSNKKEAISSKSSEKELRAEMKTYIEDYDEDRVYVSDIKKLFNWYNILLKNNLIVAEKPKKEVKEEKSKEVKKEVKKAVPKAKKGTAKKDEKPKAKKAVAQKPAAKKAPKKDK